MDGEGLLALMACIICMIMVPFALLDRDTAKWKAAVLAFAVALFGLYAWTYTTEEFRQELFMFIDSFRR